MRDEVYQKGWSWYESLFPQPKLQQKSGEATTEYSQTRSFPRTVERLHHHAPDAQLVFVMRHPFETLESRWRQSLGNRDPINRRFERAVRSYGPLLENVMYWQTIMDYRKYFNYDQLLVLLFEDFISSPSTALLRVFNHIGVDPSFIPEDIEVADNRGADKDIDTATVSLLRKIPGSTYVRDVVPLSMRHSLRTFTRTKPEQPKWSRELVSWVHAQIENDSRQALEYAGKSSDFWDLGDSWPD